MRRRGINACEYLFLRECSERGEHALYVVVEEAMASGPPEDIAVAPGKIIHGAMSITCDPSCQLFELVWPSYVAYGVRNESFTSSDDAEEFEGRNYGCTANPTSATTWLAVHSPPTNTPAR